MAEVIARFSMTDDGGDTSLEVPSETNMQDLMEGIAQLITLYLKQFSRVATKNGSFVDANWFFMLLEGRVAFLFGESGNNRVFSRRDEFHKFFNELEDNLK